MKKWVCKSLALLYQDFDISKMKIVFSSMGLSVCLFACLFVSNIAEKIYEWNKVKFYGGVQGVKRSKWLNFDGELDHDLAFVEICAVLWKIFSSYMSKLTEALRLTDKRTSY